MPVEGLDNEFVVSVACGDSITCCLTQDGKVYAWGTFRNATGIFGFSPTVQIQDIPALVPELKDVVSISAGSNHVVAITSAGKIYTWGVGEQNQLGRKITSRQLVESSLTPRAINFKPYRLSSKYSAVYCGAYHTLLVHETHRVFAFGLNNHGQLGLGDCEEYDKPELVEGLEKDVPIKKVAAGEHHSMILNKNGSLF
jgi:regulator of chromosome condensation